MAKSMSQPSNQVFIGFTLEVSGLGDFFTLDDPVKGLLDNTDFPLADPEVLVEVTEDVRSITTRRGRSRELDKFQTGSADVVLSNANRKYDPTNARETGTRQNLIPNPSFEAALTNWSTGQSFFTIAPITRQNLATNPSFETSLAGWTTDATELTTSGAVAVQSTTEAFAGTFSAQVDSTSSTQGLSLRLFGLSPNTTYRISAFLYPEFGDKARLLARDVINNVTATPSAFATAQDFTRVDTTLTTGAGTGFILDTDLLDTGELGGDGVEVVVSLVGEEAGVSSLLLDDPIEGLLDTATLGPDSGARFWVDAVMVEEVATLDPFFDGTFRDPSLNDATSAFDGAVNLSTSTLTFANLPTVSLDGSLARFGTTSAKVEMFTRFAGQGIFTTVSGLTPSTTHTISCFAFVGAGSAVKLATRDVTNGITGTTSSTTGTAGFVRIDSQVTTGASTANVLIAVFTDADFLTPGAGPFSVFNIDAVLVEAVDSVGLYFDGNVADPAILLPVTSFEGTPNNSISNLTFSIHDTGSPFFPDIVPRKALKVTTNGLSTFTGIIDDWNFSYEIKGDATAQVVGGDDFTLISQTSISPHAAGQQTTGQRIESILTRPEVNWPAARRNIDTGTQQVGEQDIGGVGASARPTPTLNYLQQVEQAEFGALFMSKDGLVTFRERTGSQGVPSVKFADDSTGIPFTDVAIDFGTEELRNRISIFREGSNTQITAEDLTSIANFGISEFDINNSLLATNEAAEAAATYILNRYSRPILRIDQISVVLNDITTAQVAQVLALELADPVEITFTPEGIGDPIVQVLTVDSISHTIDSVSHVVTFNFSQSSIGFVLDDAVNGVLNTSELGF